MEGLGPRRAGGTAPHRSDRAGSDPTEDKIEDVRVGEVVVTAKTDIDGHHGPAPGTELGREATLSTEKLEDNLAAGISSGPSGGLELPLEFINITQRFLIGAAGLLNMRRAAFRFGAARDGCSRGSEGMQGAKLPRITSGNRDSTVRAARTKSGSK